MIFPKATMVIHFWLDQMIPLCTYTHECLLRGGASMVSRIIKGGKKTCHVEEEVYNKLDPVAPYMFPESTLMSLIH